MNPPENLSKTIGILADDLTSAADGAAPFLRGFGAVRVHRGVPGDQTHAVLAIDAFTLTCELAPGFPAGTAASAGRPLSITMKAGGFGGPEALRDAAWRPLCR